MTTALEKLVKILVDAPRAIGSILDDWDRLDGDSQEQYAIDTEWLLTSTRRQILAHAGDQSLWPTLLLAENATKELALLGDRMEAAMGFRCEDFLPPGLARALCSVWTDSSAPIADARPGWLVTTFCGNNNGNQAVDRNVGDAVFSVTKGQPAVTNYATAPLLLDEAA